jgi:hypothetical protein
MSYQYVDDEDVDAWCRYPQYRQWFNKLYVTDLFGYSCGPAGIPVPRPGSYVVRPVYNLAGMGLCAKIVYLTPEDTSLIPPGYFWVERFVGTHYSVDYVRDEHGFTQLNCYTGENDPDYLSRFYRWKKSDYQFVLPKEVANIDVPRINIEAIGDKIIEVHLRNGFDHLMQYDEIIPVFALDPPKSLLGYEFVEGVVGHGWLDNPRLGYWVR